MSVALDVDGDSNGGAQTGSVVHLGIEAFHRAKHNHAEEGLRALSAALPDFPKADARKAEKWARAYFADPENQKAQVTHLEFPVTLDLDGVTIQGTLDQVRLHEDGTSRVWDVKTGTYLTPQGMRDEYCVQQALYVLAARQTLGIDVQPGGLVRVAGYDFKRGDVWVWANEKTVEACKELVAPIVDIVRGIRQGNRDFRPSDEACRFCPAKKLGLPECQTSPLVTLGVK